MTAATGRRYRHSHRWYVDGALATGSANGTSWANAWKTLGAISWGGIGAGDIIYISGGSSSQTYTGSGSVTLLTVGASGSSGRPITITKGIEAGHNGTVILDSQSGGRDGIDIIGRSYVTVQQLTVQNPGTGSTDPIWIDGRTGGSTPVQTNDIIIQDMTLHVGGTNNNANSRGIECRNITVAGSGGVIFRRNYIDTADSGGANGGSFTDQTDCIYVQSVTVDNAVTIDGNTCIQRNSNSNGHNDCIQVVSCNAMTISNNYLEQKYNGTNLHCLLLSDPANGKAYTVYNNVLRCTGTGPIVALFQNTSNLTTSTNGILKFYNNTLDGQGWCISLASANVATEFKNNIIHADGASSIGFVNGYSPTSASQVDNNDVYLTNSATYSDSPHVGWDANGQSGNPNFTSAAAYPSANYRITVGSAAIDNGATLAAVPNDADGYSRPQGSAYDIGAYEYRP